MKSLGFIKLDRKITKWEWYKDRNVKDVFIHCLLSANFEDRLYKGTYIKRGSFVCSTYTIANETGLSRQEVRTALKKLQSTNELTVETSTQGTIITINNWADYQVKNDEKTTIFATHEQPTKNDFYQPTSENDENNQNNGLNSGYIVGCYDEINDFSNPRSNLPKQQSSTTNKNKEDIRYIDIDKEDKGAQRSQSINFLISNIKEPFYISEVVESNLDLIYSEIAIHFGRGALHNHLSYIAREVNRNFYEIDSVQSYLLTSAERYYNRLDR